MEYTKKEEKNYNLHNIKTDKFKTITVKLNFKRPLIKEEITKRNLLVNTLNEGTKNYPSRRLLEIKTEDLYDLAYQVVNYASGKFSVLSFDVTFINPKYTESCMLDESFEFIKELIYNVNVDGNSIASNNFELGYNVMRDYLDTIKENTNVYSQMRMLEEMNEPYVSYRSSGYLEDLKLINREELYNYYLDVVNNDAVDIFVIGDITIDQSKSLIDKFFEFKNNKKITDSHFYHHENINDEVKFISENTDKEQSTLVVGLKLDGLTDFERMYVLSVYNYILGGGTDSNLFKTVREEHSLCYYINSLVQPVLNLGMIKCGINADQYEQTISLIHEELDNMKKGKFDDCKLENAVTTYLNSLVELEDNPDNIISMHCSMEYLKTEPIEVRKEQIVKVTKDDVIKLANKIHLNMIYLLEGSGEIAEE